MEVAEIPALDTFLNSSLTALTPLRCLGRAFASLSNGSGSTPISISAESSISPETPEAEGSTSRALTWEARENAFLIFPTESSSIKLRALLEALVRGEIGLEEAERRIRLLAIEELEQLARLDVSRVMRRGVPEIVLGEGKSREELRRIASLMLSSAGRAIISRVSRKDADYVVEKVKPHRYKYEELARILILYSEDYRPVKTGGRVAIMSGGTADIRVAEEARVVAEEMGCDVKTFYDVGIAAL